jgi:hypothetical protein
VRPIISSQSSAIATCTPSTPDNKTRENITNRISLCGLANKLLTLPEYSYGSVSSVCPSGVQEFRVN